MFAGSFSQYSVSVHFHMWNLDIWTVRMGVQVCRMVICASCWHVLWNIAQQVFVKITLHELFKLQVLLILGVGLLLRQKVLSHKPLVIGPLELQVTGVDGRSGAVLLEAHGFSNCLLLLER